MSRYSTATAKGIATLLQPIRREELPMLKNSFLGRRDDPSPAANPSRASPESPRYAPQPDAPALSAVAVTPLASAPTNGLSNAGAERRSATNAPTAATEHSETTTALGATGASGLPRLTVGPNIKLKGAEINDCDTLVVEGHVEASMDSKTLEILKSGSYEGTVTIDVAEIHGKFEGTLTARKKLIVHASGWVSGTVRYGSLLVSEGGVVSGDIAAISDDRSSPQAPLFAGYPSARSGSGKPSEPNHVTP